MTSLIVVNPLVLTDAMLVSSNVPEADYAAYVASTTYALGGRVIVVATHTVYESLQASNVGHDPTLAANSAWWIKVSPTNRWKCVDTSNSTQTVNTGTISYRITPGQVVNCVALLNAYADSVRIRMIDPVAGTVYDKTTSLLGTLRNSSWYDFFYSRRMRKNQAIALDLPSFYGADILIDLTVSTGNASLGVLIFGYQQFLGEGIKYGARVGITDYSTKTTNQWGDTVFNKLAFAKRANFAMQVLNSEIDDFQTQLAEFRGTPCLWIGSSLYACTVVYGWANDFEIQIAYATVSDGTIDLKGLT